MPIYHDPTEKRKGTAIEDEFFQVAVPLKGLERMTGADFLITPLNSPLKELTDRPSRIAMLKAHCEAGMLVQRKTGSDLLNSIVELPEFEARMQVWSPDPWLLVTDVHRGRTGGVSTKGRHKSKWTWNNVRGALDAWQDRGGCVAVLERGETITEWCVLRERRTKKWKEDKEVAHVPKDGRQRLVMLDESWYSTLRAWPKGIGRQMLAALARYISEMWERPPTLANAIALAASTEVTQIPGWGKGSRDKVREWYGVNESITPAYLGAKSGAWIYHRDTIDLAGKKRVEIFLGGDVYVQDGKVVVKKKVSLGTMDNPMEEETE